MKISLNLILFSLLMFVCSSLVNAQDVSDKTGNLIRPPYLKKGDTIMILSPAGRLRDRQGIEAGTELANQWGLVVFYGNHLLSQEGSFAGNDEERLEDLQKALDDPSIKAIWASRGGYGTVRVVDDLDFSLFRQNPKWIIGFSDITILHNKMNQLGYQSLHAQMPVTLELKNPEQKESIRSLHRALFGKKLEYKINRDDSDRDGLGSGQLVGGNLSIVYSMLGSDTNLKMKGKVLFLEEVGEALYHIDRMMISLKRAGFFEQCNGLIIGDFKLKANSGNPFGKTLEEIVLQATEGTDFPIVFNFPAGHLDDNRALIMGSSVELSVGKKKSKISFRP
ncbi:MAG: LD-carboxypeptidase [Lutimonas sp.]